MSNNKLEGSIPAELGNSPHLYSINVWGNRLTGTIPKISGLNVDLVAPQTSLGTSTAFNTYI